MEQSIHEIKKDKPLSKHFSNLFNAYAKAINKKYNRVGSLFQENEKKLSITHITLTRSLILLPIRLNTVFVIVLPIIPIRPIKAFSQINRRFYCEMK